MAACPPYFFSSLLARLVQGAPTSARHFPPPRVRWVALSALFASRDPGVGTAPTERLLDGGAADDRVGRAGYTTGTPGRPAGAAPSRPGSGTSTSLDRRPHEPDASHGGSGNPVG
jgi:hypothetical protein